jgi:hypothetical protein
MVFQAQILINSRQLSALSIQLWGLGKHNPGGEIGYFRKKKVSKLLIYKKI